MLNLGTDAAPTDHAAYAAAGVFLFTFTLISLRSVGRFHVDRPAVALFGGALMVLFAVVSPTEAVGAINVDVLLLLLGMMIVVAGLDVCGFFDHVSSKIAATSRDPVHFLALLFIATAALSALVLNDTIVLLMTPVVIRSCRSMGLRPAPFLVAEAIAANVGSVATQVGNPQNAYIAIQSRIPFLDFTLGLLLPTALSLLVAFLVVRWVFRDDLSRPIHPSARPVEPVRERRGLAVTLAVVAAVVVAFFTSPPSALPAIAFAGGAVVIFLLPMVSSAGPADLLRRVDWTILLFFAGLFVVIKGLDTSGLTDGLIDALSGGNEVGVWSLTAEAAILSNLVSNVPAVLLLAPVVGGAPAAAQPSLWLVLAATSTLGGNATILGAAANVIVLQAAAREGVEVSVRDFMRAGVPTALLTVPLAALLLSL